MHNGSYMYSFGGSSGSVVRHAVGASCVCFGAGGRQVGDGQKMRAMTRFEPTEGRHSRAVHSCVVPTSGACVLVPTMPTATETQMHLKAPRKTDDRDEVPETATLLQHYSPRRPYPCRGYVSTRVGCRYLASRRVQILLSTSGADLAV